MKLLNIFPSVRRLRRDNARLNDDLVASANQVTAINRELTAANCAKAGLQEQLDHTREKRNLLHRQIEELNLQLAKQSGTIDALVAERRNAETLINEQRLIIAEGHKRDERWSNTVDTLNASLRDRLGELEDARAELAAAQAELAKRTRPVLFKREAGMADEQLAEILAGKSSMKEIKALLQIVEECAVQCMSEAASAPLATITDGPHASRGYSTEDRTFSAGGAYALTELRRRLDEKLTPQTRDENP